MASLISVVPLWAALGDNAPPIPATYNSSHPRLPHPDNGFLSGLANNPVALARYNAAADAWDSTNPGNTSQLRRLVIAYLANKTSNPVRAATYLAKIKALANLGGTWGQLLYAADDGAGNGSYTITSASANFLTGCRGSSCLGNILSINARTFIITSVPNANTVVLNQANPAPSGTNLKIRIFPDLGFANLNIALIYDWLYNDLDTTTKTEFLSELEVLCTEWEENYIGLRASPYNDVFYIRLGTFGLIGALAIYPDHPKGLTHLRFMTDVWFNVLMPVWNQVFGPEGGGWHEGWPDYVNAVNGAGLHTFIVPSLLSWQIATGDAIFTRESWLKNFAYFTMYMNKPDMVMESIGDSSRPYLTSEYDIGIGAGLGSLNGLAEIYNDPVLRGWARLVNHESPAGPDGFEPSAWPFYTPDKNINSASSRSALPPVRNFTGWGVLSMRTGWSEDDTFVTLKYGDNFWSHEHMDTGAFTIFNRGNLALDSGSYRSGSASKHENQYGRQTIAHNSLTITDPADFYPTTFSTVDESGNSIQLAPPNDGGQRRVGTGYNERFPQFVSPNVLGDWLQNWDYYHMGTMVSFASTQTYTYTAVDITAAYNNKFSASTPNATNRTRRVQKAVRHLLFVPRGTAAYIIVFDQVVSTNGSFVKRWLLHTVNRPAVAGNRFEIVRNELVTPLPYPDYWPGMFQGLLKYASPDLKYQYNGKLYGWMVQPEGGTINLVGGPGKEFWVEDPLKPGTGTNWNQCMLGQCAANTEGLGAAENFINPDPNTGPHEPGSWRIEVQPTIPATEDFFLHVMLATTAGDSSVPANVTAPANLPAGTVGATWSDNGKKYTLTFPKNGLGGHITISGPGGVDEELLSQAQPLPAQLQIVSGTPQTAPAGDVAANPLVVAVKDGSQNALPNAVVHFGVTQGSGFLSSGSATTDSRGLATVTLKTGPGTIGSVTKVMADVNGLPPVEFAVTIVGATAGSPTLSLLSCAPASLSVGAISTCTVTLSQAAGSGGAAVTLSSTTQALAIPSTVSVPAGSNSATFTAMFGAAFTGQSAVVTGTLNSSSQTVSLTLLSATPVLSPVLSSVSCAATGLSLGATLGCTVTLSPAAGSGGATVTLSSNTQGLVVPATVLVPAGSSSATFTATAVSGDIGQTAAITATFNDVSKTASLSLLAASDGIPIPTNSWLMVPTRGLPAQTVGFEKLVYAPSPVKKAVMLGNYHELGTEPNQSLIAYDFETNRWSVLDIGASFHSENMPESGHPVGAFAYDPNQKTFIYYCCSSGANQPEDVFYTWWFDPIGQTGRSKATSPKPMMNGVPQPGSSFDPVNSTYVVHGGGSFVGTWTYNPETNAYEHQTPKGTLPNPSVDLPSMTYNTSDHKVYLFGGQVGAAFSNDLFTYDVPTNTWTQLSPSGLKPSPRWRSGFAYDSTNNVFLLYGGQDATQVYNDSWIYAPATNKWTQLTLAQSPPLGLVGPFETLAYDSDHNVFILVLAGQDGYADGRWTTHALQTWLFRYQGTGPKAGAAQLDSQPTSGAINQNADAWAKEPSLAGSGNTLYAAWVETGKPFDLTEGTWFHAYAKQRSSDGTWMPMGGSPTSLDSEFANYTESHSPSISVINGTPWISWYKWNNSGQVAWGLWAKSWNGTAWQGGAVGRVGKDPARAFQGRSQMADVAGVPHIAFLEVDKSFYPQKTFVYVKYWNGTQWVLKGSGPLNINPSANTTAGAVSIASDGTNPYVAWTEYTSDATTQNQTPSQVYVSRWKGTQWVAVGGSLNVSNTQWSDDVSIACLSGQPYVAWTERTTGGNAQIFVKTFDGDQWVWAGPGISNKDTRTGWAFRPTLVADASSDSLYLGWVEQQALGQRSQTYVSAFRDGTWTALGASLNADADLGSAQRVSLAVVGRRPTAAWGEVNLGSLRQVFVKQWDGSSWIPLSEKISKTPPSCSGLDVQTAINQALGIVPCTTADLKQDGQCNVIDVQRVINFTLSGACLVGQ